MKMPNMGNSFIYFRHFCGLIPDRPSEPARQYKCFTSDERQIILTNSLDLYLLDTQLQIALCDMRYVI